MVRFVTIKKFCELTGMTPAAVYTRKCKGVWLEGTVWLYAPGSKTILMDLVGFEKWVEQGNVVDQLPIGGSMKSPTPPQLSGGGSALSSRRSSPLRPQLEPRSPSPRRRAAKG